mgnify:CR=1 FL=1
MGQEERVQMHEFIKDYWSFIKDHWKVTDTDEYWNELLDAGDALARKYKDAGADIFGTVKALTVAFMKTLEKRANECGH